MRGPCAQRNADADFVRLRGNGVGDDAEDTNGDEEEGERGEGAESNRRKKKEMT